MVHVNKIECNLVDKVDSLIGSHITKDSAGIYIGDSIAA